jgi:hypothetical protein
MSDKQSTLDGKIKRRLSAREALESYRADMQNKSIAEFRSDLYGAAIKDVRIMTAADYKGICPYDETRARLPIAIVIELNTGVLITALVDDAIQNLGVMKFYNKRTKSSHQDWELVRKGDAHGVL